MLASDYRFHGHGSLNYLYRNGKTVRGRLFMLKFVQNKRREANRASVVVSRKVAKSAVVRNRIRRRLYEVLRLHWKQIVAPTDLVVTVLSVEVATIPAKELNHMLFELLKQSHLYQAAPASDIVEGSL